MLPNANDLRPANDSPSKGSRLKTILIIVGLAVFACALIFGNYHVVQSSQGSALVQKVHFTFSETFVSLDAITGQPLITAKAQNPLAVKALQRDGILETDEQMQQRVQKEVEAQVQQQQRDFQVQQQVAAAKAQSDLAVSSIDTTSDSFSWSIVGTVTNKGTVPYQFVKVDFDLLTTDGQTVVDSTTDIMSGVLHPGEKWRFSAMVVSDQAKRYRLSGVSGMEAQ